MEANVTTYNPKDLFFKQPTNFLAAQKLLQVLSVVLIVSIGGAYLAAPDPTVWEENLSTLQNQKDKKLQEIRNLEMQAAKTKGIDVEPIELEKAIYLSRFMGIEQVKVGPNYIDLELPLNTDNENKITAPMIADHIRKVRAIFKMNCSLQSIWPKVVVRIYVKKI
jgi:hypothetical protein